ncbi:hypothetical protein PAMC26510_04865 [Caballeronia sordidicola]|uniref:Uncharacterized protein n=1 Tax=Caballeronia sordidicola TaxID=196367 RepID=A0A242N892_CABSO|nr:hypothetical protein PAMC26510_04865 [Caballeronia sordidicola]
MLHCGGQFARSRGARLAPYPRPGALLGTYICASFDANRV